MNRAACIGKGFRGEWPGSLLRWFALLVLAAQGGRAELAITASTSYIQAGEVGRLANLARAVPLRNGTALLAELAAADHRAAVVLSSGGPLTAFRAESFGATQTGRTSPFLGLAADGDNAIVVSRTGADNSRVGLFSLGPDQNVRPLADLTDLFRSVGFNGAVAQLAAAEGTVAIALYNPNTRPGGPFQSPLRLALVRDGSVSMLAATNGPQGFTGFDGLNVQPGPAVYFSSVVNGVRNLYRWLPDIFTLLVPGGGGGGGPPLQIGNFAVAADGAIALADTSGRRVVLWQDGQVSPLAAENAVASDGTVFRMTAGPRVLRVTESDVYFTGARSYRYSSGSLIERDDIVFRVPRAGGRLETFFHPSRAGLDGPRVSLVDLAMGSTSDLTITASENLGFQRAIWRGRSAFTPTPFPAVPSGYPRIDLAVQTRDYLQPGRVLTLGAQTESTGPVTYSWSHDGSAIPRDSDFYRGAETAQLALWPYAQPYHTGGYTVAASNASGTSYAYTEFEIDAAGHQDGVGTSFPLVNISLRAFTGRDENALLAGIALLPRLISLGFANGQNFRNYETGVQRRMLIRAVGPGLAPFVNASTLPSATRLTLFRDGQMLATNDGHWNAIAGIVAATAAAGAFPLAEDSRDSALLLDLPQQNHTARIDAPAGDGTALIEFYPIGGAGNIRNLSARARVTENDPQTLTIGFVIAELPNGIPYRTILLRAVGPGLRALNVAGATPAVQLDVFEGSTRIAANADHRRAPNAADIARVSAAYGAFPLANGDAGVLLTLPAGVYTARISAGSGSSGVALAELYTNVGF